MSVSFRSTYPPSAYLRTISDSPSFITKLPSSVCLNFAPAISVSILLLREQFLVNDEQWLKRMISHHSTALTTSNKIYNRTNNYKIKDLAKEIIDTQEREITLMKSML